MRGLGAVARSDEGSDCAILVATARAAQDAVRHAQRFRRAPAGARGDGALALADGHLGVGVEANGVQQIRRRRNDDRQRQRLGRRGIGAFGRIHGGRDRGAGLDEAGPGD